MPNATHYRSAAQRLRTMGEAAARQAATVSRWNFDGEIGPGLVRDTTRDALLDAERAFTVGSNDLARLARVCEARAAICDDYRRQLLEYYARPLLERIVLDPLPPLPPYSWVSA